MSKECQLPIGADDVCGLPPDSQVHTNFNNAQRHDFVEGEENDIEQSV